VRKNLHATLTLRAPSGEAIDYAEVKVFQLAAAGNLTILHG